MGLGGIEQIAQALFATGFQQLTAVQQDQVIQSLADGNPPGEVWQSVSPVRFFEELLTELTENYYAHPWAQDEIGYVGYADLPSWANIGLNQKDAWEE